MKIVSLKCPECRASIHIEEGMTQCFCPHCGTQILLDDESQKVKITFENADETGYRFEQGRQRAQYDTPVNIELANKIKLIQDSYASLSALRPHAESVQYSLKGLQEQLTKIDSPSEKISPVLVPGAVLLLSLFAALNTESFTVFLFGALFAVTLYFAMSRVRNTKRYKLIEQINQETADFNQTQKEMQEIVERANFDLVPVDYRNYDALNHFYKTLSSGRAFNLSQAISLYEEDQKEEVNQALLRRQVRLQEEQLEYLRANAEKEAEAPVPQDTKKPNTTETILAIGGALYAGAKFMKELNKRRR